MNSSDKPAKKRVLVTVISDLVTDQRVHKVCQTLHDAGYSVHLTGASRRRSLPLANRDYAAQRISMLFQRGALFYAEFNVRLFLRLLFSKGDILLGNDLDVMPATWLAAKLKRKPVVYDTHEYFLEMAGLDNKPIRRRCWQIIERTIFPRVQSVYTICDSFCEMYHRDYGLKLRTVRNVPYKNRQAVAVDAALISAIDRQIPKGKKLLLFQGAGINQHRGAEELVSAMKFLNPKEFHLLIIGGGDIIDLIRRMIDDEKLADRITMIPKVPFGVLAHFTAQADLGLSLDKAENINHRFGLPNKIFDYLHAGIPVLVSRLVELEKIVNDYQVGTFIDHHDPEHIATCMRQALSDPDRIRLWRKNTVRVREELNWELEGKIVIDIFKQVESEAG